MFRSLTLTKRLKKCFARGKKDYYKILGLKKNATKAEIKRAFAKMAQKYHPDKDPDKNSKTKFAEISEAY